MLLITDENIYHAIEKLSASGIEPNYLTVKTELGAGSYSQISKVIKIWKANTDNDSLKQQLTKAQIEVNVLRRKLNKANEVIIQLESHIEEIIGSVERDAVDTHKVVNQTQEMVCILEGQLQELAEEKQAADTKVDQLQQNNQKLSSRIENAKQFIKMHILPDVYQK